MDPARFAGTLVRAQVILCLVSLGIAFVLYLSMVPTPAGLILQPVLYTITTGLRLKWRASLAAAIGCTLGIIPHILASIADLSALLNMSAQVFSVLKLAGAGYLLYLAWNMWRETGTTVRSYFDLELGVDRGMHVFSADFACSEFNGEFVDPCPCRGHDPAIHGSHLYNSASDHTICINNSYADPDPSGYDFHARDL